MIFKDSRIYDYLKLIALIILPLGTLISSLMTEWGIPNAEHVMNSFKYLDVFIGAIVVISNQVYKKSLEDKSE